MISNFFLNEALPLKPSPFAMVGAELSFLTKMPLP